MKVAVKGTPAVNQTMRDMKIGDVALVTGDWYRGEYVLRTFSGVISLSKPNSTWNLRSIPAHSVTILPPGTEIALVTE